MTGWETIVDFEVNQNKIDTRILSGELRGGFLQHSLLRKSTLPKRARPIFCPDPGEAC